MSCKSCLYAANTASQTVADGGVVNFGSIVRRFGQNALLSGGNVNLYGAGYYDIDVNVAFTASTVDTVTVALYKDGTEIPGASATVTTAASTSYSVSVPAVVRQMCCCESTLTAVVSGASVDVTNAAVVVKKV